jgi:hypothetical protein
MPVGAETTLIGVVIVRILVCRFEVLFFPPLHSWQTEAVEEVARRSPELD